MKQMLLVLSLGVIVLSACGALPAASTPLPAEIDMTAPAIPDVQILPSSTSFVPTATEGVLDAKLPGPPFEAQTYVDEAAGFALDYPSGWTVNEMVLGERGSQVQFLSAPELADAPSLPAGATRVFATIYQWDPRNDLAAYSANWESAWQASGFTVMEKQELVLEQGLPAVQYLVQTPEAQTVFLVTALRDQYLVLSGEGDLALAREIVGRVRPITQ